MEQPFSFFKKPENATERKHIQETIEKAVNTFTKEDTDMSSLDSLHLLRNHNSYDGTLIENEHYRIIKDKIADLQQQIASIDEYLKKVAGNSIIINNQEIDAKEKTLQQALAQLQQAELNRKETTKYNNDEWEAFQHATEDFFTEIALNSITHEEELMIEQKRQAINEKSIQLQQLIAEKKEISYDDYDDEDENISGPSDIREITQEQLN